MWGLPSCSYHNPRLTLTYLTHLNWDFFETLIFLKTVEALIIILTLYVLPNETTAINKFTEVKVEL